MKLIKGDARFRNSSERLIPIKINQIKTNKIKITHPLALMYHDRITKQRPKHGRFFSWKIVVRRKKINNLKERKKIKSNLEELQFVMALNRLVECVVAREKEREKDKRLAKFEKLR